MNADERADHAHGIVFKEHGASLVDVPVEEEADHFRYIRLSGTALQPAEGLFALETALGFIDYMDCHCLSPTYRNVIFIILSYDIPLDNRFYSLLL